MFSDCSSLNTIYVSDKWSYNGDQSDGMFSNCLNLVGEEGTIYSEEHIDGEYARVDTGEEAPGYFTFKARRDLNDDGKVSTADIQVIINTMKVGQQSENADPIYDLNKDGKISTADIQVIINEMKK